LGTPFRGSAEGGWVPIHELSIAQAIVDVATRSAGDSRVTRVYVKVGRLRQVVPAALEFSFELCTHGTAAEGAALELEEVPIGVACRSCGAASEPAGFPLACAACGALRVDVVRGEELLVESLELEAELMTSGG
jgi:hydrogenase nickel incorporation protein HypA/HybF